jgi:hypothetical protein
MCYTTVARFPCVERAFEINMRKMKVGLCWHSLKHFISSTQALLHVDTSMMDPAYGSLVTNS